jgi:exodeoxyribonuclease V alpha subunit
MTESQILKELKALYKEDVVNEYENLIYTFKQTYIFLENEDFLLVSSFFKRFPFLNANDFKSHLFLLALLYSLKEGSLCLTLPLENEFYQNYLSSFILEEQKEDSLFKDKRLTLFYKKINEQKKEVSFYFSRYFKKLQSLNLSFQRFFKANLKKDVDEKEWQTIFESCQKKAQVILNEKQKQAVLTALNGCMTLIKGGPGTGKTTITSFIIECFGQYFGQRGNLKVPYIVILGFTGRSVSRVKESLRESCVINPYFSFLDTMLKEDCIIFQTIHRFLSENKEWELKKNKLSLKLDLLIIDELSMVSPFLLERFLPLISPHTKVILLGDPYQLPSIEEGSLFDILLSPHSGFNGEVISLQKSNRTQEGSINALLEKMRESFEIQEAKSLNPFKALLEVPSPLKKDYFKKKDIKDLFEIGDIRDISHVLEKKAGTYLLCLEESQEREGAFVLKKIFNEYYAPHFERIMHLKKQEIYLSEAFEMLEGFRILSPLNLGEMGSEFINQFLLKEYQKIWGDQVEGLPCLILKNQYHLGLNNGDLGIIFQKQFVLNANNDFLFHPLNHMKDYEISFATSIHKSQGSEYETVFIFLPHYTPYTLLTRQILYTGFSRAKKKVIVVSSKETLLQSLNCVFKRDNGILY